MFHLSDVMSMSVTYLYIDNFSTIFSVCWLIFQIRCNTFSDNKNSLKKSANSINVCDIIKLLEILFYRIKSWQAVCWWRIFFVELGELKKLWGEFEMAFPIQSIFIAKNSILSVPPFPGKAIQWSLSYLFFFPNDSNILKISA